MVALYKLLLILTSVILLLMTNSVDSTWNDAEGGTIPVAVDKLSWPQVSSSVISDFIQVVCKTGEYVVVNPV
jgi:hypothetical protein